MNAEIIFSIAEIDQAAASFWADAKQFSTITFTGDMGGGKTTFVAALCRHIGVQDPVSSPTYALVNEYTYQEEDGAFHTISHMDWYRLSGEDEAFEAGITEYFEYDEGYRFIEWPEKAAAILPAQRLDVTISETEDGKRMVRY